MDMLTRRVVIRSLAQAIVALGAAALVWRSRLIQVGMFLLAAGLSGRYRAQLGTRAASRSTEWSTLPPMVKASSAALNPRVLITYHPEYQNFQPRLAIASLEAVARLGIGWIRTDLRWHQILPDGMQPDRRALDWYRAFLRAAAECGLRSMVVLSTPPKAVLRQDGSARLISWNRFVETVVSDDLGAHCGVYALMNEPNNPAYRFFSLEEGATALVQGASIIRSAHKQAKVAINVTMEFWGWRRYLTEILRLSGRAVDIVGLDHYPGTWTVGLQNRWAEVVEIADRVASAPRGSPWFGRRVAIMETGFSTNAPMRDEEQQSKYFENVASVVARLPRSAGGDGAVFGIYELCDGSSSAWLDPEAHFGLLTSDLQPKRAFATVAQIVASF